MDWPTELTQPLRSSVLRSPQCLAALLASALLLAACLGPGTDLTGTYTGSYTATTNPGVRFEGTFQLTQDGSNVTGRFSTTAGRSGTIRGSVEGSRLTATMSFTDRCAGSAQTTVDILDGGSRLVGTYEAKDCLGRYSGGFDVTKQE